MNFDYDIYSESINKHNEQFCGDYCVVKRASGKTAIVLADGLGSGLTANLQASMVSNMIVNLAQSSRDIKKVVANAAFSMNKDSERNLNYCAFVFLDLDNEGKLLVMNFNMPDPVVLHRGKVLKLKPQIVKNGGDKLKIVTYNLSMGDNVILISDGVLKAGIGSRMNLGLGKQNVEAYIEAAYKPKITSEKLAKLLLNVCSSLSLQKPVDDFTVTAVRAVKRIDNT